MVGHRQGGHQGHMEAPMTLSTVPPLAARVAAVLAGQDRWIRGRRHIDGALFYAIPGSGDRIYFTSADNCTCPDSQQRGHLCKHSLAVRERSGGRERRPTPRVTYGELFPDDEPATVVTIVRRCAVLGCPLEAASDAPLCPHHERERRARSA